MVHLFQLYDVKPEALRSFIDKMDVDRDGQISEGEFVEQMSRLTKEVSSDLNVAKLKKLFLQADYDNSGFLSMDEVYNLLTLNLGIEIRRSEFEALVGAKDIDFDSQLNIDEFIDLMAKGDDESTAVVNI